MNIHSSTTNYFRTTTHTGIRQKVGRRKPLDLPGGLLLWQAVGKLLLWSLPVVLGINLWCVSAIDSQGAKSSETLQKLEQLHRSNADLQVQINRLMSPVRIKIAAAEKLDLYEPTPEQIQHM